MATTPRLGLSLIEATAAPVTEHNTTVRLLDILANMSVIDRITASPGSPAAGDTYLIDGTGSDDWVGHDDVIAWYDGSAWNYIDRFEGMRFWVADDNDYIGWTGAAYVTIY